MAALAVVFHHAGFYYVPGFREEMLKWIDPGVSGVMVLFPVSGYIIPASLERTGSLRRFWIGRTFRAVLFTGTVLYRAERGKLRLRTAVLTAGAVLVCAMVAGIVHFAQQGLPPAAELAHQRSWVAGVLLAAVIFGAGLALRRRRMPRWLAELGVISYSVYLLHPLLLSAGDRLLGRPDHDQPIFVAVFLIVLIPICRLGSEDIEGRPMKVDAYSHILPAPYFERMRELAVDPGAFKRWLELPALHDMDARLRMMDEFGDGYQQVLTLSSPPIEVLAGPSESAALARLANESMRELCDEHPDRFPAFVASLPMNNPDAAIGELASAIDDLGARGVQVFTNVNGMPLDDPAFQEHQDHHPSPGGHDPVPGRPDRAGLERPARQPHLRRRLRTPATRTAAEATAGLLPPVLRRHRAVRLRHRHSVRPGEERVMKCIQMKPKRISVPRTPLDLRSPSGKPLPY